MKGRGSEALVQLRAPRAQEWPLFCPIFSSTHHFYSPRHWFLTHLTQQVFHTSGTIGFQGHFLFHEYGIHSMIRDPKCFNLRYILPNFYAPFLRYGNPGTPFLVQNLFIKFSIYLGQNMWQKNVFFLPSFISGNAPKVLVNPVVISNFFCMICTS